MCHRVIKDRSPLWIEVGTRIRSISCCLSGNPCERNQATKNLPIIPARLPVQTLVFK